MNLGELKQIFESIDDKSIVLKYGLSEPFSWRGIYSEVAFSIEKNVTVAECLQRINKALRETFYGYKGGEYTYDSYTPVNFESSHCDYTDGEYIEEMISLIEGRPVEPDRTKYLVKLMTEKCND